MQQEEDPAIVRWRLILGRDADPQQQAPGLSQEQQGMDQVLEALYQSDRQAGLGSSAPHVNRWLGDIRTYFPNPVVSILQQDAMDRLGLQQMLAEPEILETLVPDIHLVAQLIALSEVIPDQSRESARQVVRQLAEQVSKRLQGPLLQAVRGSLNRARRNLRPSLREMDWNRTILVNLKHYQPAYRSIIPERKIGFSRQGRGLKQVILLVDQSASMADSVVYSGILACTLASVPALDTRLVLFDTGMADLSGQLSDPVDVLFGVQLGGGTDIGQALQYAAQLISKPADTLLFLISDLDEGADLELMMNRAWELKQRGVGFFTLLSLSDAGKPAWHKENARAFRKLGIPCFSATPDAFPDVLADAIEGRIETSRK